jgi:UDP-N-acetylglucosamine 1-carboxyvinyltransferase
MEKLVITGGKSLSGTVRISGAKNAALPLMCAGLLTDGALTLTNLPRLMDIQTLESVLVHLGLSTTRQRHNKGQKMTLTAAEEIDTNAPYDMVRKMRASILVLGPLVAKYGHARVSLPGGCAIGNRPIDLHLKGLEQLGAKITLEGGYVEATTPKGHLVGANIVMPLVSVGATENLMMAACLAHGTTTIENAAREPEITDLAICMNAMGAKVSGMGTGIITIEGVKTLGSATHNVMADRIEAGSYAIAGAITKGHIILEGLDSAIMGSTFEALREMGVGVEEKTDGIHIDARDRTLKGITLKTQPYPGFATDMQAQFMALATLVDGASVITENIFENRFMHVPELSRMGADITVSGNTATVRGVSGLKGAPVMATDLRASFSLVIAGLMAEGITEVNRLYHLDRGYEKLEEKLNKLGANVERLSD